MPLRENRNFWKNVPENLWNDWRWQLKNRISTRKQLEEKIALEPEEIAFFQAAGTTKMPFAITPHFLNLIVPADKNDPLRKQIIPRIDEEKIAPEESADPLNEEKFSKTPNLVHRYPDRVLLIATKNCASFCRFCTRARIVSKPYGNDVCGDFEAELKYISEHKEIRDVLISGGDFLTLPDEKIDALLGKIRQIKHVEFLRIGSRVPVFLPQRITPKLCEIFKKHGPIFLSIHVNHKNEIAPETASALEKLAFAGTVFGSQSVLLRGVNDDAETLKALFHKLLQIRVRPYYLYVCDLVAGTKHFRVPAQKGVEIIRKLRGFTSGYALPQLVIDAPGGGGKIPLNPNYVEKIHENGAIEMRNFLGEKYVYPV